MAAGLPRYILIRLINYLFLAPFLICLKLDKRGFYMFFPTIYSANTDERHIVKDKYTCACGARYNVFTMLTRRDLRKISFKHYKEVTCPECKSSIIYKE